MKRAGGKGACILLWGLVILIPAGLVVGGGWPWLERMGILEREIATAEDQLTQYQRLIASLPGLQAELKQVLSNEDVKAFYYDAPTPQLVAAQMQRELQDMVKEAGARLISAQILSANTEERPPKVSIRTQLQGETEALLDLLFRIEQARPFLFVDQLSVRASARRAARRNPRLRARRAPVQANRNELTIRLDISGYAIVGSG